jgi:hypothetical protein
MVNDPPDSLEPGGIKEIFPLYLSPDVLGTVKKKLD